MQEQAPQHNQLDLLNATEAKKLSESFPLKHALQAVRQSAEVGYRKVYIDVYDSQVENGSAVFTERTAKILRRRDRKFKVVLERNEEKALTTWIISW